MLYVQRSSVFSSPPVIIKEEGACFLFYRGCYIIFIFIALSYLCQGRISIFRLVKWNVPCKAGARHPASPAPGKTPD